MMPADISITRLAVIALVALVTSIIAGLARRRRGRAVRPSRHSLSFLRPAVLAGSITRCFRMSTPHGQFHTLAQEAMRVLAVFAPSCGAEAKLS
jgi:hypothetical protein